MFLASEKDKVAHLLRRFGLGASEAEVTYYGQGGLSGAIDKLLNYDKVPEGFQMDVSRLQKDKNGKVQALRPQAVQVWWYSNLLTSQHPLEQKMTIFWHHHFATSAEKVDSGEAMHVQIETLRKNCLGRFEDILMAVSHDPAMLYWLDNGDNVVGKPNENFAREVMELFTLGVGNYTEKDVQESARAFTGWRYGIMGPNGRILPTPKLPRKDTTFVFVPRLHDAGVKEILGNKGPFNGDDVCGILAGHPRTPHFLVKKIWDWFVYPNPDDAIVDKFANEFRNNGLEVKHLLRAIMESPEFYSDKAYRSVVKNPIDFAVVAMRQLGIGQMVSELAGQDAGDQALPRYAIFGNQVKVATKAMGMELAYPPDVSGWRTGSYWISTATMLERMKLADSLFLGQAVPQGKEGKIIRRANGYNSWALFAGNGDPNAAAQKVVSIFDAPVTRERMNGLGEAANRISGGQVTQANAHTVAATLTKLVFGSPEFQFC